MTPKDLYRTCCVSAWRLETLQHYTVPDDAERQRAFHAGEPLPSPQDWLLDDLRLVTELQGAGRHVGRVHVVDRPLAPYIRYELAVYAENVAAGEDVRIADRSVHPELNGLRDDFVIFDAETSHSAVVLFDYDGTGLVRGYQITTDPENMQRCQDQLALALRWSVPAGEFTATAA